MAKREQKRSELPSYYYLDESDPDILILCRKNGSFVAAFSAQGATRESIVEAAEKDYRTLQAQKPAGDEREAGGDRDA